MISLGFSTIGCPDYDVDQVIAMARDNGYTGVEIRFLRGTVDIATLEEFSPKGIGETRRRFEDGGIKVSAINTGIRMTSLDPAVRAKQMESARVQTDMAVALGAKYLRVFGGPLPAEQDKEKTLDAIAEGLSEVAELSERSGVTSLIETHDSFCRSSSILDLYRRGASQKLCVLWDTLHSFRWGETAEETWAQLGDRIRLVHMKDSTKATPEGFDFALIGEGIMPVMSFYEVLERGGYNGYFDFEWEKGWHREIPDPEVALPHFARFMAERIGK